MEVVAKVVAEVVAEVVTYLDINLSCISAM